MEPEPQSCTVKERPDDSLWRGRLYPRILDITLLRVIRSVLSAISGRGQFQIPTCRPTRSLTFHVRH